jgi:hypothetical protein
MGKRFSNYFELAQQYEAAIPPHIAEIDIDISPCLLAAVDEGTRELTRFDVEQGGRLSAFGPVLLRSEAAASSQIEQLTASARAIFTAETGGQTARNASLVAANTASVNADGKWVQYCRLKMGPLRKT